MPPSKLRKQRSGGKTLYRAAKISDYQFKKVLWHFVLDHSAERAASQMDLSANSIGAIYAKLRRFFFDHGLFVDPYRGGDPRDGYERGGDEEIEFRMLDFHLRRVSAKHGSLDARPGEPDYHLAESYWRSHFSSLRDERGDEAVSRLMYDNLFEFVRRFGPVGSITPIATAKLLAAKQLVLEQQDRRILWLERNASSLRDPDSRQALRQLRNS